METLVATADLSLATYHPEDDVLLMKILSLLERGRVWGASHTGDYGVWVTRAVMAIMRVMGVMGVMGIMGIMGIMGSASHTGDLGGVAISSFIVGES